MPRKRKLETSNSGMTGGSSSSSGAASSSTGDAAFVKSCLLGYLNDVHNCLMKHIEKGQAELDALEKKHREEEGDAAAA